ncbi:FAD-binding protein [Flavisolibacter sp. BT320]|nr:FAD-binding protein [Flavisolibacter longurius]
MIIHRTGQRSWTNRHQTFTQSIVDLYDLGNENTGNALADYNDATKGIQKLIDECVASNTELRALGGEWSWTKVAAANGILLNTKPLNLSFRIHQGNVCGEYAKTPDDLYFAQCGVSVKELNNRLRQHNRSLKTTGASNGQTIAGAISTGTHGAAIDVGAMQDFIVGLHIIAGPSKHIWLERESYPVVSEDFAAKLQTTIIRDDELFNAALISFGSFGFIHGVMMETEPLFLYEAYRIRVGVENSLFQLLQTLNFTEANLPCGSERPAYFQMLMNPYDASRQAFLNVMYKRAYGPYAPFPPSPTGIGPGDDAPAFIGRLTDTVPALVPTLVNNLIGGSYKPFQKLMGTHAEFFNNTNIQGKVMSTAVGLPITEIKKVTEILLRLNKIEGPFTGVFAYRFVKGTRATLGFTRFNPGCVLELDGFYSNLTMRFYQAFWEILMKEAIPHTFHWGKMFDVDGTRIRKMYSDDAVNSWMAARNAILETETCKTTFTNALLRQWQLDLSGFMA